MTEPLTRTKYSYDAASQLAGMTYTLGANTLGSLTYSYDADGRRASVGGSFAQTGLPLAVSQTAYNADNQLTQWGTANLFYDANGNMTSDGTHSYSWDARNRLSQIDSGSTANFAYDSFGRRTSKTILGAQTGFLYDGVNSVQELSGATVTANSLTGGVDEVFQRTDSAGARSFLADALGSTLGLADSSGAIQTSYSYEPFGNTSVSGTSTSNSVAYTGRELDATGLYFYRARYYNPTTGRFISEDPNGIGGGINLYAYAANNPIVLRDPLGRRPSPGRSGFGGLRPCPGQDMEFLCDSNGRRAAGNPRGAAAQPVAGPPVFAAGMLGGIVAAGLDGGVTAVTTDAGVEFAGGNGIEISQQAFDHVLERHLEGGIDSAGNSIFSGGEDEVANLIEQSQTSNGIVQGNGNIAYVNYASDPIGYTAYGQTNIYTVIVDSDGNLVTTFPGFPGRP